MLEVPSSLGRDWSALARGVREPVEAFLAAAPATRAPVAASIVLAEDG
jgi:hypothetical protein